jgi:hypothetical protein
VPRPYNLLIGEGTTKGQRGLGMNPFIPTTGGDSGGTNTNSANTGGSISDSSGGTYCLDFSDGTSWCLPSTNTLLLIGGGIVAFLLFMKRR